MAEERARCAATTRADTRCKNRSQPGSRYCHVHLALAESESVPADKPPVGNDRTAEPDDEALRREMAAEIDDLIEEVRDTYPEFEPPPFSPQAMIALIKENLEHLPPPARVDVLLRLREAVAREDRFDVEAWRGIWTIIHYWRYQRDTFVRRLGALPFDLPADRLKKLAGLFSEDLLDPDTWKGLWFMATYSAKYQADVVRRRFTGEYETDEWGLDWEFLEAIRPFFTFLYKYYWRVEANGLENIPDYERALIVSNHSGQLPFDGAMIGMAVLTEHPAQRLVRNLYADWFPSLPFLAPLFEKMGQTLASVENGTQLLENEELVAVYPEGYKGVGKLFKDRYRLARFGRGGFVKMTLNTQAPIIPTAVVGAEETYISLYKSALLAKATGFPYFPLSPTWPWLGLLGLVPLPTKWTIDFGEAIPMDGYPPDAAQNLVLVSQLTDQVRNVVQEMIMERLAQRRSVFLG